MGQGSSSETLASFIWNVRIHGVKQLPVSLFIGVRGRSREAFFLDVGRRLQESLELDQASFLRNSNTVLSVLVGNLRVFEGESYERVSLFVFKDLKEEEKKKTDLPRAPTAA